MLVIVRYSESDDLEKFYQIIDDWDLQPHDQYLELESVADDYDYETILEHTLTRVIGNVKTNSRYDSN